MKLLYGIAVLFVFWSNVCEGQMIFAPYQVTIRMYDNNAAQSFSLCNGAVVHESYVLTTAHCMYSHVFGTNISRPLLPSMIYVIGGNFSNSPSNTRTVSNIHVHEGYNATSFSNDIALIQLSQPLPMRNSNDIKWLQLDNGLIRNMTNCSTVFLGPMSSGYPFAQPQYMQNFENFYCNQISNITRPDAICSQYVFGDTYMCKTPADQLLLSADRGTPFVCNNLLTGILSTVLPADNSTTTSCFSTRKTYAFYTKISPYENWIHQKISSTQPQGTPNTLPPAYNVPAGNGYYPPPPNGQAPMQPPPMPPATHAPPKKNASQSQHITMGWLMASLIALCVAKQYSNMA